MTDPRFPVLTQKQIRTLKEFGTVVTFENETAIAKIGDSNYDFYVVLDGEICVKDPLNENLIIVTHGVNEFTGDNSMLSNRILPFSAYAAKGTTVLHIKPDILKDIISKHSDISDLLLGAFIQRQETILRDFHGGIKVIGTENSKETYGLRDLWRKIISGIPFSTQIDLKRHSNYWKVLILAMKIYPLL
jgi:thioredoxin reductase (NADPH)